jgi:hypothetical protein
MLITGEGVIVFTYICIAMLIDGSAWLCGTTVSPASIVCVSRAYAAYLYIELFNDAI